jgi:Leucine-rich repeat (LRR) protein
LKEGFQVYAINESNNLLEVKFIGPSSTKPDLSVLESIKDQLVWLQLTNCGITDEDLKIIGNLPNLFKLNLNRNKITDKGIAALSGLNKLESLNLYGTSITDSSIGSLQNLTSLKKLYVWETGVDTLRMETMWKSKKGLEIVYKLVP